MRTGGKWYYQEGTSQMISDDTTVAALGAGLYVFTDADKHGDRQADAALIAAAPEMLAALKQALSTFKNMPEHTMSTTHIKNITAAIEKAEGR